MRVVCDVYFTIYYVLVYVTRVCDTCSIYNFCFLPVALDLA